ncbi:MAG: hypothetical protein H6719_06505 [Sandaracinaceae bacterium]|nr:hypothetical protein [Sandaracinaceae bacterium]
MRAATLFVALAALLGCEDPSTPDASAPADAASADGAVGDDAGSPDDGGAPAVDAGDAGSTGAEVTGAVEVVSGARHACARLEGGEVLCWGSNTGGQLGDGTRIARLVAAPVDALDGAAGVLAVGAFHTCAQTDRLFCWGHDVYGQLGIGGTVGAALPELARGLGARAVSRVAGGADHTCALDELGRAYCAGRNASGQLGTGTRSDDTRFARAAGDVEGLVDVGCGDAHSCALDPSGAVLCWGANERGQLGLGDSFDRLEPTPIPELVATDLAVGARHTCAALPDGTVACWGWGARARLGGLPSSLTPVVLPDLADVVEVDAGEAHTCARHADGTVSCWGENRLGALGVGSDEPATSPLPVLGLADVAALGAGSGFTCAVHVDGGVACWGANESGQLGDGTTETRTAPVAVRRGAP